MRDPVDQGISENPLAKSEVCPGCGAKPGEPHKATDENAAKACIDWHIKNDEGEFCFGCGEPKDNGKPHGLDGTGANGGCV